MTADPRADDRTPADRGYVAQLGDVLRQRSVTGLRAFLEAQAGRYGDERQVEAIRVQSDAELEQLLHRMTLARPDLSDLHAESQRWLTQQGSAGRPSTPGTPQPPAVGRGRPSSRRPRRPGGPRRQPPSNPAER